MDKIREWFGTRYDEQLDKVERFWAGEGHYMVTVKRENTYRRPTDDDAFLEDFSQWLQAQAKLPGIGMPELSLAWGTTSTAKYWGGTVLLTGDGNSTHITPVAQTAEEAAAIDPLPIMADGMDVPRALHYYELACDALDTDLLWLRTPDFQGTLNTASLVMDQQEMLVEMYTEPDALHGFLEKVAAHLIRYGKTCHEAAGGKVPGNGWPAAFFPAELGAAFTEDLMPLLSPEKYAEFGIPQLRRFGDAFGGMLIHCCGQWGQHAQNLADSGLPIRAIEFHHPHTTLEQIKPLAEQGVVLIPYLAMNLQDEYDSVIAFYEHLLAETPYRYWFVFHNDTEDAVAFAEKHAV